MLGHCFLLSFMNNKLTRFFQFPKLVFCLSLNIFIVLIISLITHSIHVICLNNIINQKHKNVCMCKYAYALICFEVVMRNAWHDSSKSKELYVRFTKPVDRVSPK